MRIGSFPTLAYAWMPYIIRNFPEKYPHIQIELVEENSIFRLEDWLSTGFVDVVFFSRQPKHTYARVDLKTDPYLAVLPSDYPQAAESALSVQQLLKNPFCMCRSLDGEDQDISRYLKEYDTKGRYPMTSNSDSTILCMVEELGVSILPKLFLDHVLQNRAYRVKTCPLEKPVCRRLGLAARSFRELSPAASRLVQVAMDFFRE